MDCSVTKIHFLLFFFSGEEVLTQRGYRQMYKMPNGVLERKVWHHNLYRIRIKV